MNKDAQKIIGWLSVLFIIIGALFVWITWEQETVGVDSAPAVTDVLESPTPTPTEEIRIVFVDDIPVAVMTDLPTATPTNTVAPTATPTEMPTATPTMDQKPTKAVKPTNTPTPTEKPKQSESVRYTKGSAGTREADTDGTHGYKPWARHTAVTNKSSRQYKLEQIAITDAVGRRVVKDPNGEWRFLIALPVYWAGGTAEDIGRCVDIKMANGAVLKCVLADIKKIENSQGGQGKYGKKGEIIEVICDKSKLIDAVRDSGDASRFGAEWVGDVKEVTALDLFIKF